jgi:hypothetical protein
MACDHAPINDIGYTMLAERFSGLVCGLARALVVSNPRLVNQPFSLWFAMVFCLLLRGRRARVCPAGGAGPDLWVNACADAGVRSQDQLVGP